jgi:predicted XRE-type DNA-binding protein
MAKKNIFLAMGFEPEDAMIQALRVDLAEAISAALDMRRVTPKEAARLLGLSQGVVSNIRNGKVDHLSLERLMRAMVRAKIPGFACWPSAEGARAGLLTGSSDSAIVNMPIEIEGEANPEYASTRLDSSVADSGTH